MRFAYIYPSVGRHHWESIYDDYRKSGNAAQDCVNGPVVVGLVYLVASIYPQINVKRAYLHIGLENTGTTSLQVFLKTNEGVLKAKGFSCLCDDTSPYYSEAGHFPLAACFFPTCPDFVAPSKFRPASEVLAALRQDAERCPEHLILSCEHFSSRLECRDNLRTIREALTGREVKVICYLRRQDDLAVSAYATMVLYGHRKPFSAEGIQPAKRYFNFADILDLWASVFGKDSIVVREFSRDRLIGGDVRCDFLHVLGLDSDGFCFGRDENVSLDAKQVEALRLVNRFLPTFRESDRGTFDLAQQVRGALIECLPNGKPLTAMLGASARCAIMSRFQDVNARVAEAFAGEEVLNTWQERAGDWEPDPSPIAMAPEELAATIAALGYRLAELRRKTETAASKSAPEETYKEPVIVRRAFLAISRSASRLRASCWLFVAASRAPPGDTVAGDCAI